MSKQAETRAVASVPRQEPTMTDLQYDDSEHPLAYFITFRTHGTWLHGDQRTSVDRHGWNVFGTERIGLDPVYSVTMDRNMTTQPLTLSGPQRAIVESAIRDVCSFRDYRLIAINIRTNHGHVVVAAAADPDKVLSAFKANATRELREAGLVTPVQKVWSRGGSTRYLWKPASVDRAVEYTVNGQGAEIPDF